MANKRVFQAQGLTTHGVAVGGLARIGFDARSQVVQSSPDGAVGVEDVDVVGVAVDASMECADITKVNAILDAAVGNTTYSGKESGAATWHNYTVPGIVWHGMSMNFAKQQDASLSLNGAMRFTSGATKLSDMLVMSGGGAVAPTLTYPKRLFRPHSAAFTPDGGSAITPLHLESMSLSLEDAGLLRAFADLDVGETAVDRTGWGPLRVTFVHGDASVQGTSHMSAKLLEQVRGQLVVTLLGRGGAGNYTLTIQNLVWSDVGDQLGSEYGEFTMQGIAGWRKPGTVYEVNATPELFKFASV